MQGFIIISLLCLLGFIFFCIYFIFKQMQFVIQAINLYKDMVIRQDAMIKLLKDIRDSQNGTTKGEYSDDINIPQSTATEGMQQAKKEKIDINSVANKSPQEIYESGYCPECGTGRVGEGGRCTECQMNFFEFAKIAFEKK